MWFQSIIQHLFWARLSKIAKQDEAVRKAEKNNAGFVIRMPAEWEEQGGVQLTWPHAATDWAPMLDEVETCFTAIAREVALREHLLIVAPDPEAVRMRIADEVNMKNVCFAACPSNDTWARDHGAITLVNGDGDAYIVDFGFNGWGRKYEAELDNRITRRLWDDNILRGAYVDRLSFTLEGGSVESDGRGTLMTTSACLLAPNRNEPMTKADIETYLLDALVSDRLLWIDHGHIVGDDTDGHIDTLARFAPGDTILYMSCSDPADEQYVDLKQMEEQLRTFRTATARPYRLLPLPMPRPITDADGQRLPATYANYLVLNGAVLCPTYGQPDLDAEAMHIVSTAFPGREVVGIDCRPLIRQHGSLHCVTMQYPPGAFPGRR